MWLKRGEISSKPFLRKLFRMSCSTSSAVSLLSLPGTAVMLRMEHDRRLHRSPAADAVPTPSPLLHHGRKPFGIGGLRLLLQVHVLQVGFAVRFTWSSTTRVLSMDERTGDGQFRVQQVAVVVGHVPQKAISGLRARWKCRMRAVLFLPFSRRPSVRSCTRTFVRNCPPHTDDSRSEYGSS